MQGMKLCLFFAYGYSIIPASFVEKTNFSFELPFYLVENQLKLYVWTNLWTLFWSIDLSIFCCNGGSDGLSSFFYILSKALISFE